MLPTVVPRATRPRLALRLLSSLVPAPSPAAVPGGPDKDHASKAVILPAIARATVVSDADAHSPLHKAMNRATKGVTVHAHTLRPCHALCKRHR